MPSGGETPLGTPIFSDFSDRFEGYLYMCFEKEIAMNQNRNFQQRQQAQMQRQRQMGAAWMAQQKKKAEQAAADDPFIRLEQRVDHLRKEYAAGRVSKEGAETDLRENILEDAQGDRWMVGFETGKWYRYENGAWVPAQRPVVWESAGVEGAKSRPVAGCMAFLFGLAVTAAAGFLAAYIVYEVLGSPDGADLLAAILVWGLGLILSVRWGWRVGKAL